MSKSRRSVLENNAILRRFAILFFALSFLPFFLVFSFYNQLQALGLIDNSFVVAFLLMIIGTAIAYWGMRTVLRDLLNVVKVHTETLGQLLGKERFQELTGGGNEIAVLANTFDEVIHQLEDHVRRLEMTKNTLHSVLRKVGRGLSSSGNMDNFLELILDTIVDALNAGQGALLILDDKGTRLSVKAVHGGGAKTPVNGSFDLKPGALDSVLKKRKAGIITHFEPGELPAGWELTPPLLCAPMTAHDQVFGVIMIGGREEGRLTRSELNLLSNIALQTAVALENSRLNENAEKTYFETISALALAVEAKDPYSRGHLERVAGYAVRIAERLGLDEEQRVILRDAARLHDIGKIGILDEVLRKPAKLTDEEYEIMKKHPQIGEGIIAPIRSLRNLCGIVRHHHEMLDGSGYPDGLQGEQITLLTRILTVSDVYDALTTTRPYRKALTREEAFHIMTEDFRTKLDQSLVQAFQSIIVE